MAKKTPVNKKYMIIAISLVLALIGYIGYRKLLVSPAINQIYPGNVGGTNKQYSCERKGDNYVWTGWNCKKVK